MTRYDDETLMRHIDGELSREASASVDADASHDADLAARLAQMRGLRTLARDAFAIATDPRDAALARLVAGAAPASSPWTQLSRSLADAFAPERAALWGGLAVATFVGGVFLGPLLDDRSGRTFNLLPGGAIADDALVRVLDDRLAADGPDAQGRAVTLTYRDMDGRWCRTFRVGEAGVAGLACRDEGEWAIHALAPLGASSGEVRTAASDTPTAIISAVDAGLAGETLGADEEVRVRDGGWRQASGSPLDGLF